MNRNTKVVLLILILAIFILGAKLVSLGHEAIEVIQEANQPLPLVYPDWGNDMSGN